MSKFNFTTKEVTWTEVEPITLEKLVHMLYTTELSDHCTSSLPQGKYPTQLEVLSGSRAPVISLEDTIIHEVKVNMFFKGHVERVRIDVCKLGKTDVMI